MPRDGSRLLLRALVALVLAAIAWHGRGAPDAATAFLLALVVLAFAAARVPQLRRGSRRQELAAAIGPALLPALIVLALLLGGGLVQALRGDRGPVAMPWITLVGIPLALWLDGKQGPLVPATPAPALLLVFSLALGLLALEPWLDSTGSALLATAVGLAVLDLAVGTANRAVPEGSPLPGVASRRRALVAAVRTALLVLLLALAIHELLAPVPRLVHERPDETPREDLLAERIARTAAEARALRGGLDKAQGGAAAAERAVALVRAVETAEPAGALPLPLYLRERVFDEVRESGHFVYFAARSGDSALRRDEDDGKEDLRVPWPEPTGTPNRVGSVFQVTLVSDALDTLLLVPTPLWIEGQAFTFRADGAVLRPAANGGTFTYRTCSVPTAGETLGKRGKQVGAVDPRSSEVPTNFKERGWLEGIAAPFMAGAEDDLAGAQRLSLHLKKTGRLDPTAAFRGWRAFLGGPRAGGPEHFAQCLALLARLAHLPARVVEGYRTREYVAEEKRWQARGRDRWWWTEIEFEQLGWIPFDPTPDRAGPTAQQNVAASTAASERASTQDDVGARQVRETLLHERPLVVGLLLLFLFALFLAFPELRMPLERILGPRPPAGTSGPARRAWRYWQELLDTCARSGLPAQPWQTAQEFAAVVVATVPETFAGVTRLVRIYHHCRFGGEDLAAADEAAAKELLQRLAAALKARGSAERRNRR